MTNDLYFCDKCWTAYTSPEEHQTCSRKVKHFRLVADEDSVNILNQMADDYETEALAELEEDTGRYTPDAEL